MANDDRVEKLQVTDGQLVGWIGGIRATPTGGAPGCIEGEIGSATPGWCTGGYSQMGQGDGMFSEAAGVYVDEAGFLYVTDRGNHRIQKFVSETGNFVGWSGAIKLSPTGGKAGCQGSLPGSTTPGWCIGGRSQAGESDGALQSPSGIHGDGNWLYVADTENNRIVRIDRESGLQQGWIGRIEDVPTGGAASCSVQAAYQATPGWCVGGSATGGFGDGMLNGPKGIFASNGNLLVADFFNHRISRYHAATGAFAGWRGGILESPTAGDAGCANAPSGRPAPGWCLGGRAAAGTDVGTFWLPQAVHVDPFGQLYVGERANSRVTRILP